MQEYCYTSVCGHSDVPAELQEQSTKELCSVVRNIIASAGVSGLFEISPCPFVVINELQSKENDTVAEAFHKIRICEKLGIVEFSATDGMDI